MDPRSIQLQDEMLCRVCHWISEVSHRCTVQLTLLSIICHAKGAIIPKRRKLSVLYYKLAYEKDRAGKPFKRSFRLALGFVNDVFGYLKSARNSNDAKHVVPQRYVQPASKSQV